MTNEEAVRQIIEHMMIHCIGVYPHIKIGEALDMAISALREQENKRYNTHEVACIIAELFGDDCACNFNGIDEWLPFKCELLDACPRPCGVACWEQYLKYRHCRDEMEAKEE